MEYRDFTFPEVETELGLTGREESLFAAVPPFDPDPGFAAQIADGVALATPAGNEKARSEWIIAPVLQYVRRTLGVPCGLFSGVTFNVDPARKLNGVCDFLFTRSPRLLVVTAPVVAVAESKPDVPVTGFGQCVAAMVAAREFNRRAGGPDGPIYGASTSGTLWVFLRLVGDDLLYDLEEYPITNLPKILGILRFCVRDGSGLTGPG